MDVQIDRVRNSPLISQLKKQMEAVATRQESDEPVGEVVDLFSLAQGALDETREAVAAIVSHAASVPSRDPSDRPPHNLEDQLQTLVRSNLCSGIPLGFVLSPLTLRCFSHDQLFLAFCASA